MKSAAKSQPPRRQHRVFILDDHPLTRHGMAQLIGQQPDLAVCGEAGGADQALSAIASVRPEVVLADVTLPGKHGLEFIKDVQALYPEVLVLVVSMHDETLYAERALHAGARGYLMKSEGGETLLAAIRHVLAGKIYVSQSLANKILDVFSGRRHRTDDSALGALTDREFEVFEALGQGLTTRQIGTQLNMSGKTVETHRLHIREKLGFKTGAELSRYAVRWSGTKELL
jgi:DNA-binding NarL/FixJ family response regulator